MKRLQGYDAPTRRSELAAFACLGSVAVALIGFAVAEGMRYADGREEMVAKLSGETSGEAQTVVRGNTNHAFTNLAASRGWGLLPQMTVTPVRLGVPSQW